MKKLSELTNSERKLIGKGLHVCWFLDCQSVWKLKESLFCNTCHTFKCPDCKRCFCDLPKEVQFALDMEMASEGYWDINKNPPKRKKKLTIIEFASEEEFLEWVRKWFPHLIGLPIERIKAELYREIKVIPRYPSS